MAMTAAAIVATFAIPPPPETLLAHAQDTALLYHRIHAALAELAPRDRDLVLKTTVDGRSLAEAAREVGIGYECARKRYVKALARLERRLRGMAAGCQ